MFNFLKSDPNVMASSKPAEPPSVGKVFLQRQKVEEADEEVFTTPKAEPRPQVTVAKATKAAVPAPAPAPATPASKPSGGFFGFLGTKDEGEDFFIEETKVTAPAAPAAWEEARGYNELLDSFSLHQFIIRRGKTLADTPEYESFKRKYLNAWGGVTGIVKALEKMLEEFTVPVAYIDGNRVVTLARDLIGPPSNDELLSCIVNIEQVMRAHCAALV
jgi:hypothetical protein